MSGKQRSDVVAAIRKALTLLTATGQVVELRTPSTRQGTVSGYFDDWNALAKAATAWSGKAPGIYITLNAVNPDLLARACNRVKHGVKHTTKDEDITARRWLLVDLDPERSAGISATDAEHKAALARARAIRADLAERGWPAPILTDTGNGAALLYHINLRNDNAAKRLVNDVLKALAHRFTDEQVKVDTSVGSAAQLWRLPGTWNCKGDSTKDRPHRLAQLLDVPAALEIVTVEQLLTLAATLREAANGAPVRAERRSPNDADKGLDTGSRYVQAALADELSRVRQAPVGNRNNTLNKAAFNVGQLLDAGALDRDSVEEELMDAAEAIGLERQEAVSTVRSGIKAGRQQPRSIPEPSPRGSQNKGAGQAAAAPNGADTGGDWQRIVAELAVLPPIDYDRKRDEAAKELGIRVSTLDQEVARRRAEPEDPPEGGRAMAFDEPEPWPEPVAGAALLDELANTFERFLALPKGAATALALWVMHAWTHDAARVSPILVISSPEKRCGKTTLLSLLKALVPRPLPASNITAAALFRAVERWCPTLLIDEADTFLRNSDELRGILNSGHTKDAAFVIRTVGDDHEPRMFSTWAPKAVALIGNLSPTLIDRAIVITMRRKTRSERTERLRLDRRDPFQDLTRQCARWAADHRARLAEVDPAIPQGLNDRAADNWRPLLAIADAAGGEWPERANTALLELTAEDDEAAGVMLLRDIQTVFKGKGKPRLTSLELINALAAMEDSPWPEWKTGKPITVRQLARLLKPFGVQPRNIRIMKDVAKGYERDQFRDAFSRYLPPRSATPLQFSNDGASGDFRSATRGTDVADRKSPNPLNDQGCSGVADENGEA